MPDRTTLWQTAPYPQVLEDIAKKVVYKTWALNVDFYDRETSGEGLTLRIRFPAPDSREPDGPVIFWIHDFEVPARTLGTRVLQADLATSMVLENLAHFKYKIIDPD